MMAGIKLIDKKVSTLHDYPYSTPARKCPHFWIINVTPPGPAHCVHDCLYCYAREAIYSNHSAETLIYRNLPELVETDLKRISLCPPVLLSTISDPCQPIPELRNEVKRLVALLMDYGVSIAITTKGDPAFLLDLPGFISYRPKFIAVTIEGTADILHLLSPAAPSLEQRLATVQQLSALGIDTLIRLDPIFIHLFQARYGNAWFEKIEALIKDFAGTGAKHIVSSTGRLPRKSAGPDGTSLWQRIWGLIHCQSAEAAMKFENEYRYENSGTSQGYRLRKDIRLALHYRLRALAEENRMTYATCQELSAHESDSPGLAHCERFVLPFTRKLPDGQFQAIDTCTANCHVLCRDLEQPPCERSELALPRPFRTGSLR